MKRPSIKAFLSKDRKLANFGLKSWISYILECLKEDYIMDRENYKRNNQCIKDNFKMDKNMDLVNNHSKKQVLN